MINLSFNLHGANALKTRNAVTFGKIIDYNEKPKEEESLVMIKPNAVKKNAIGDIIKTIEEDHLQISALNMIQLSKEDAETHYAEHKGKGFYNELVDFMTGSPVVAMIVKGKDAINKIRQDVVPVVRAKYSDNTTENAIHASDDKPGSAEREVNFFKPKFSVVI